MVLVSCSHVLSSCLSCPMYFTYDCTNLTLTAACYSQGCTLTQLYISVGEIVSISGLCSSYFMDNGFSSYFAEFTFTRSFSRW